ncbi:hypothetical protein D9M73_171910 [compost metagenome]
MKQVGAVKHPDPNQQHDRHQQGRDGQSPRRHARGFVDLIGFIFGAAHRIGLIAGTAHLARDRNFVDPDRAGIGLGETDRIGDRGQGRIIAEFDRLELAHRHARPRRNLGEGQALRLARFAQLFPGSLGEQRRLFGR